MNPPFSILHFQKPQNGFTLIELLVGVLVTVMLTTVVVVNFRSLRFSQELSSGTSDLISKFREIQNFTLSGYELPTGERADAYEITLSEGSGNFQIHYDIDEALTLLELVNFSKNLTLTQITVGGIPTSPTLIRLTSPYGKMLVAGSTSQIAVLTLTHVYSGETKTIVIDPISGRISSQ